MDVVREPVAAEFVQQGRVLARPVSDLNVVVHAVVVILNLCSARDTLLQCYGFRVHLLAFKNLKPIVFNKAVRIHLSAFKNPNEAMSGLSLVVRIMA